MSNSALSSTRRGFLAGSTAAAAVGLVPATLSAAATTDAIRPFRVDVPEADLVDLRRRISATRWPDRETVTDQSQGVQFATIQRLAHYWATKHEWRK